MDHEIYMKEAVRLAQRAARLGEVPVGALIVVDGSIVSRAFNRRESKARPTAHAELLAIEAAARKLKRWRLTDARLYVTLEPCLMCWGAIVLARVTEVYFGAWDAKAGVCGSTLDLSKEPHWNHHPRVTGGILQEDCSKLLSDFFTDLRKSKKMMAKRGQASIGG